MAQLYYKLIPCSGLQSVSFRKVLGSQGRRAFFNTQTQGRRVAGQRLKPAKNLSSKCYLVVVYLLDMCIIKVFLIITKGSRTMKLGWITYKNFKVDLNEVPVRTIEAIIKDLPEGHEGRAKMQALLKDAYRDLERQLQYEIEN